MSRSRAKQQTPDASACISTGRKPRPTLARFTAHSKSAWADPCSSCGLVRLLAPLFTDSPGSPSVAAISLTLFPSIANRACDNPASSVSPPSPTDPFTSGDATCYLSFGAITLSWIGAWIVFARLLGLIFPLPDVSTRRSLSVPTPHQGHEGTSLLRPQVGYGRIVAGEAFELGGDDDDDDD